MTREEYIDFANALKNNYTIDFDMIPEFCDMAISALSTDGEYIKKLDILNELGDTNMDILTDEVKEIVNDLPSYSFPDSKSVIDKVLEVIKSERFKTYDYYASLAPSLGDSCREKFEADMEIYDGVIEAVELYRDSDSDNSDSAENKGKSKHGHWVRMSDLPEDKDDRYKCSRCGNVVHHSNGVNLYTFNSWCGKCGSLNNSLIAGLEPKGEKGTE